MKTVKVAVYGVGPIGSGIVGLLSRKSWAQVIGAVDCDDQKAGKDLGEVAGLGRKMGVIVSRDARELFRQTSPDVVIHATSSFLLPRRDWRRKHPYADRRRGNDSDTSERARLREDRPTWRESNNAALRHLRSTTSRRHNYGHRFIVRGSLHKRETCAQ